jgi:hypothetical protein
MITNQASLVIGYGVLNPLDIARDTSQAKHLLAIVSTRDQTDLVVALFLLALQHNRRAVVNLKKSNYYTECFKLWK